MQLSSFFLASSLFTHILRFSHNHSNVNIYVCKAKAIENPRNCLFAGLFHIGSMQLLMTIFPLSRGKESHNLNAKHLTNHPQDGSFFFSTHLNIFLSSETRKNEHTFEGRFVRGLSNGNNSIIHSTERCCRLSGLDPLIWL